ncbi:MAG: hypothetical protein WBQ32_02455 [Ignavibacteriaceae bacterium]
MKKLKVFLASVTLLLSFAGCLQVETTLHVSKDGSGTINEKVLFSKSFVNMIKEFAQSFDDSASADTEGFSIFKEDEIKADSKNYGENVEYVSHELISNDNWEGYQVIYSFDDISKVKITPDPDSKVAIGDEGSEIPPEEDYYFFRFVKGDISELIIDRPEIELASETEEENATEESEQNGDEAGEEFLKMMEGMSISVAVEVEGKILNSNANYVDGSKVTLFEMNFGEMMKDKEAFKEFKNKEPKNIEEMKEFLEKFPGMKIEVEKPVSIKFN